MKLFKKKTHYIYSIIFLLISQISLADNIHEFKLGDKKKKTKFSVNKYGTLIGIQRGQFFNIELGVEQQKKQLKLQTPNTIAWAFNMEYAWDTNTLGYKLGGWFKTGRMGFTYGANALGTTNFERYNFGVAPTLGFKLIGFHLITSYNLFMNNKANYDYNVMHVSIRYFISRQRKYSKN